MYFKSLLFIIIIIVLIPIHSDAQFSQINFEHGLQGGINISQLYEMDNSYSPKIGYQGGYTIEAGFIGHSFSFNSGIGYSREGARRRVQGVNTDFIRDYISVPFTLRYYFNDYGLTGVHLFTGPVLNYLVKSDVIFNMGEDTVTDNYSDQTTDMLYAIQMGAGTKITKGVINLRAGLQFNRSFNEVYKGEALNGGSSTTLSFILGIIF